MICDTIAKSVLAVVGTGRKLTLDSIARGIGLALRVGPADRRKISSTLQRLKRKGLVRHVHGNAWLWESVTAAKKQRYRASPKLGDGSHWTVVNSAAEIAELVREWAENQELYPAERRSGFSVCIVMMSDAEVAALPEI